MIIIMFFIINTADTLKAQHTLPSPAIPDCHVIKWEPLVDSIVQLGAEEKIVKLVEFSNRYVHCFDEKFDAEQQLNFLEKLISIYLNQGMIRQAEETDTLTYNFIEKNAPEFRYRYSGQKFRLLAMDKSYPLDEMYTEVLEGAIKAQDRNSECRIRSSYLSWLMSNGEIKLAEDELKSFETRNEFLQCNDCTIYDIGFKAVYYFIELEYPGWNYNKLDFYAKRAIQCVDDNEQLAIKVNYLLTFRTMYRNLGKVSLAEEYLKQALSESQKLQLCGAKVNAQLAWFSQKILPGLPQSERAFLEDFFRNQIDLRELSIQNNYAIYSSMTSARMHMKAASEQAAINQQQEETLLEYAGREGFFIFILVTLGLLVTASVIILLQYRSRVMQKQKLLTQTAEMEKINAFYDGELLERERVARDLHDSVGSMLAAARFKLQMNEIDEMDGILTKAMAEVRFISHNLKPLYLKDKSLILALKELCEQLSSTKMVILFFVSDIAADGLETMKESIYRMVQELIFNAMKHSGADKLIVQVRREIEHFVLEVEDNGHGFQDRIYKGIGLSNIDSRLLDLRGNMVIQTSQEGTSVEITIPLLITEN